MTETIESARYGKPLTLGRQLYRGGQGRVFATDDPVLLVKQFEAAFIADDLQRQEALKRQAECAYPAFATVNNSAHVELRSLPREYVCLQGKPAYLMEKAEGALLQTFLRDQALALAERLLLGLALARALRLLHLAQMIHTDVHPDNYIVFRTPFGWMVVVIDIDGGGLLSPPGPIYPMSQPKRVYKAPELFTTKWRELDQLGLFYAPDDWALSVLLYQLLVDYQGPFCSTSKHPDPAITNYEPYAPYAYRDPKAAWPQPWQKALLKRAGLPDQVVSLFYATFQHRFILEANGRLRPTAAEWQRALQDAITPPPPVPVSTVLVPPPPVRGKAPQVIRHGWAAKARGMFLTPWARFASALGAAFSPRHGAFRWRPAVAGTVTALRLSATSPLSEAVPAVVGLGQPVCIAQSAAGVSMVSPSAGAAENLAAISNTRGHMMRTLLQPTSHLTMAPETTATARVTPVVISERKEQIIRACLCYQFLTVEDFCFLLGLPASRSYVRKILALLSGNTDHAPGQYLYRFPLPQRAGGNPLRVFVPGRQARGLLRHLGEEEDFPRITPEAMRNYSYSFVSHNLAVSRLAICATLLCRKHPDYYLAEMRLAHQMAPNPPRVSLVTAGQETQIRVIPDCWLLIQQIADGRGYGVWLEVDNGTEAKTAFKRRCRTRLKLIESELYAAYFGTPSVIIAYAVVGKTKELADERVRALRTWTAQVLATENLTHFASTFLFTPIEYDTLYDHTDELFLNKIWQLPDDPTPVALLAPPHPEETPRGPETSDQTL